MVAASELSINGNASAMDMAEAIFGAGVELKSATYTGASQSSGIYSDGLSTSPGVVPSDEGVILSTGRASDFTNSYGTANQAGNTTTSMGTAGDSDLTAVSGYRTYDAAVLEATFIPEGSELTMQIVFSSEEYLEYVGTGFNDVCAIWVNGVQAELTVGTGDITINNINPGSNSNLYQNNPASTDPHNTEMDGFTVTLTLKAPVSPGQENTIKIGIADAGDRLYDSNLLIAGDSIQCALIAGDDEVSTAIGQDVVLDALANDSSLSGGTLTITHVNGQAVVAGSTVVLPTGEAILVNADGTLTITGDDEAGSNVFTYTVQDGDGNTDVAFVEVETVPCFTRGTLIITAEGQRPVEDLQPDDLVMTRDHGLQPLRWVGCRRVRASGTFAPVVIAESAFGNHAELRVSQQHRVLVRSPRWDVDLGLGTSEALVSAKSLVGHDGVYLDRSGGTVEYFHLLFDQHEIIWSNGLPTESYHPGPLTMAGLDDGARREVLSLFPEIDPDTLSGYGPAARPVIKRFEARAVLGY
ncbi:choice-of-anchor L domain-containing protein [Pseudooceanicola marinus]|nr:choice-of-anchor L domain-containing protein [Pseudooceanicola marinus]PJE26540.1 2,3,4,5-tetrahydropyridine-2,6-carboxylate N-succinyltransferase [Pseudooceanicola marinus]